jgi:replication-associated recombination protein RarA
MNRPIVHPATELLLQTLSKDMPQSIILSGTTGVGLLTVANYITNNQAILVKPLNAKGEEDQAGTISVEIIRRLYDQSRTKTTSRRFIIIDNADMMSHGAQGAFLKLLEEPPAMTHFILTSHVTSKLLPTIRSRAQHIAMQLLTTEQSRQFVDDANVEDTTKKAQLQFLAGGLPAELTRLINDKDYFALRAGVISDARVLITGTEYQKLRIVHKYKQNREDAARLIDSAIAILRHSLTIKPQPSAIKQLGSLLDVRERIIRNQSTMLQLSKAVL